MTMTMTLKYVSPKPMLQPLPAPHTSGRSR